MGWRAGRGRVVVVGAGAGLLAGFLGWLPAAQGVEGPPPPIPNGVNIAVGASTAGSSPGWGGGAQPQDMVDGQIAYADTWAHGLAFTGGQPGWAGEACGARQAVVDFGAPRSFSAARVWHHGPYADHLPTTYQLQYFNGSTWQTVGGTSSVRADLDSDIFYPGSWAARPTEHLFPAVTGSRARFIFDNCQLASGHGWIYEFEVFGTAVVSTTTTSGVTVRCDGRVATIVGTPGDDVLTGTNRRDVIAGLAGNDRIDGAGGDDVICGGPGNDIITGDSSASAQNAGQDDVFGQEGDDILAGCGNRDRVSGGAGNDVIGGDDFTGPGLTYMCLRAPGALLLPNPADRLDGGDGNDHLLGGDGPDLLMAGPGDDVLLGGTDSDLLRGEAGNDILGGDDGADTCIGGAGFDVAGANCEVAVLLPQ